MPFPLPIAGLIAENIVCGGDGFPRHGKNAVLQFTALPIDGPAVFPQEVFSASPAVDGAEGGISGGGVPGCVGGLQKVIDFFAGNVAVNECFGESFGNIGRGGDGGRGPSEGEAAGALVIQQDPGGALSHLIAGAFDDESAGGKTRLHNAPGIPYFCFTVLPENIEGTDEGGVVVAQLEATEFKPHTVLGREEAGGINF